MATSSGLFTNANDTVNFNGLSPSQIEAVNDDPVDIYNTLGGNDVVTLPNETNDFELPGTNVYWDPYSNFVTGNGNDTINGADGNYFIVLGNGTDTVTITGEGQNNITGGAGFDTITVGNGENQIYLGAKGGNVTIGSGPGAGLVQSNAVVSKTAPTTNATTVGFTALAGVNLYSGVTYKRYPLGDVYLDVDLVGGLEFTNTGGTVTAIANNPTGAPLGGTGLDQLINVQYLQSGAAGGSGTTMPLDAINITVGEFDPGEAVPGGFNSPGGSDSGYGTISATDNGIAIPNVPSDVPCGFDQLMPVPDGTYDVMYRINALAKNGQPGTQPAFDFSSYDGQSWFVNTTNIELHIGNYPGDSSGCIVVGSSGSDNGFWNNFNAFMNGILTSAKAQTITAAAGQIFYPLLIPVTITVENSPAQPQLVVEDPVIQGLSSAVTFAITGLSTTAVIDKDVTFYFTVSGASASDYTVTGAGLQSKIVNGTVVYSDTIAGTHNHQDSSTNPALATIAITYTGSTLKPLTVSLVPDGTAPDGKTGLYYWAYSYGYGGTSVYDPPSQRLIGSKTSQEIDFTPQPIPILWRNSNGDTELWKSGGSNGVTSQDALSVNGSSSAPALSVEGSTGFTYENLGVVSTSWQIAGAGDFNGTGEDCILWRNTNGDTELWNPNGSSGFTYQDLGVVNTSWQIAGAGDFTGTGQDSVLWRNTNGDTELWNPNGSGGFTYQDLGVVNTSWQIAGTGDFTGRGQDSILWRNTNGNTELWNPNGSGGFTGENLGVVNTSWQIVGAGDFNGTGEDSILWRNNTSGDTELWSPIRSGGFTYQDLGVVNISWQIAATGDFTGTGQDSILWRNTNGDTELWNPNGSGGFTYQDLGVVSTSWAVQKVFA